MVNSRENVAASAFQVERRAYHLAVPLGWHGYPPVAGPVHRAERPTQSFDGQPVRPVADQVRDQHRTSTGMTLAVYDHDKRRAVLIMAPDANRATIGDAIAAATQCPAAL